MFGCENKLRNPVNFIPVEPFGLALTDFFNCPENSPGNFFLTGKYQIKKVIEIFLMFTQIKQ
jgi:hypothetical protein